MVALPREGGSHWPANFDERGKYAGRPTYSVRVIVQELTRRGSVEVSMDYVFERLPSTGWRLLETRRLLVVE